MTICGECLSSYGKGKPHNCDRVSRRDNLEQMIRQTSERSRSRVIGSQLKEIEEEKGVNRGEQFCLSSGGKLLPFSIGNKKCQNVTRVTFWCQIDR